ncbi:hypothetical protein AB2B38_010810 [Balneola sp. MJW-20]|uniref:hypothetical protein n=1 Tax=Gracilimonas aurantiaca TaxID=3234185 RepID=UPI003466CB13
MSKRSLLLCSVFITLIITNPLKAQQDVLSDRPGIGDSPFVYGKNIFGAEAGAVYLNGGADSYQLPQLLLRLGVSDKLEIRFNAGSVAFSENTDAQVQQQSAGIKYQLVADGDRFLTFMTMVDLPFLNSNFSTWNTRFSLQGRIQGNTNWGLDSNIGFGISDINDIGGGAISFTLTPSYTFDSPTGAGVYFGYATDFSISNYDNHYFELGFTLLSAKNLQLDINSAKNLFQDGFFVGAGIATAL